MSTQFFFCQPTENCPHTKRQENLVCPEGFNGERNFLIPQKNIFVSEQESLLSLYKTFVVSQDYFSRIKLVITQESEFYHVVELQNSLNLFNYLLFIIFFMRLIIIFLGLFEPAWSLACLWFGCPF